MIDITPDIMGPGIEEEYADALAAIPDLHRALGERPLTNDTPDGRVLLEVAQVGQEIRRQWLPIPVDASYAGTIYYLVGSNDLLGVRSIPDPKGIEDSLGRLWLVLKGYGVLKARRVPVLIAMIDDLCADTDKVRDRLNAEEREVIEDIRAQGTLLKRGEQPHYRRPQDRFFRYEAPNLNALGLNCGNRAAGISASLFDSWLPYPARKPPLAAPVPGLPDRAPPFGMPSASADATRQARGCPSRSGSRSSGRAPGRRGWEACAFRRASSRTASCWAVRRFAERGIVQNVE